MIRSLLPDDVAACEASAGDWNAVLEPAEEPAVARAVDKRRREFAAGRACARRAMQALGRAPVAIPAQPSRAPLWPAGVVGSITHTTGYCAAAVAEAAHVAGLGIDAEIFRPLSPAVAARVAAPEELEQLPARERASWAILIFSAKESFYKAFAPLTGLFFEFGDVRITFAGPDGAPLRDREDLTGTFTCRVRPAAKAASAAGFVHQGRFARGGDRILTTLVARRSE